MITKRPIARASAEIVQIMLSPAIRPPRLVHSHISPDLGSPICSKIRAPKKCCTANIIRAHYVMIYLQQPYNDARIAVIDTKMLRAKWVVSILKLDGRDSEFF